MHVRFTAVYEAAPFVVDTNHVIAVEGDPSNPRGTKLILSNGGFRVVAEELPSVLAKLGWVVAPAKKAQDDSDEP